MEAINRLMAALAAAHARIKPARRSWRITIDDGVYKLPPTTSVGTRPGWRYHSRKARKALNWGQFKEARRQMLAMRAVEGGVA